MIKYDFKLVSKDSSARAEIHYYARYAGCSHFYLHPEVYLELYAINKTVDDLLIIHECGFDLIDSMGGGDNNKMIDIGIDPMLPMNPTDYVVRFVCYD